jgi:hypothetical protein
MSTSDIQLHGDLEAAAARRRRDAAIAEHLDVYGAGPTFGELAIGELFYHAKPVKQMPGAHWPPPRGPLMTKASATRYQWDRGYGHAEDYYRVERA